MLSSGVLLRGSAAGSGALEGEKEGEPGEDWLWGGQALEQRLVELLPPGASQEVCFAAHALPAAEETHGAAHRRYCQAFESLMEGSDEAPQQVRPPPPPPPPPPLDTLVLHPLPSPSPQERGGGKGGGGGLSFLPAS